MNWKAFLKAIVITAIISIIMIICFAGCESTGLDKRTTLVPDSVGIGYNQADNTNIPVGWPTGWTGFSINATWNLK